MEKNFLELTCGCTIRNDKIFAYCNKHYTGTPQFGDPLAGWIDEQHNKRFGVVRPKDNEVVEFDFFNDTKKPVVVRVTPASSNKNPERIEPLDMKKLYIKRSKGFMKLWNYNDHYDLLVD